MFGSDTKSSLLDDVPAAPRNEGDSVSSVRHYTKLIICAAGLQVETHKHLTMPKCTVLDENSFAESENESIH